MCGLPPNLYIKQQQNYLYRILNRILYKLNVEKYMNI